MNKSRWIAHERFDENNKINLFCFTFPGGSASSFATWKKLIDPSINLIPILYPEREIRKKDPMEETFDKFIEDLVKDNIELFSMPYAFFGYCGGAVIAYEAAVKVKELTGKEPLWGLVASSEAPEYLRDSLVEFPQKDAKNDITEYLVSLGMFDEKIVQSEMFLQYYVPLLKADCKMLDTFIYREHDKLSLDLDVLYGKEDHTVDYEKAKQWQNVTCGEMRLEVREGGHFFVDTQKKEVCDLINQRLAGKVQ